MTHAMVNAKSDIKQGTFQNQGQSIVGILKPFDPSLGAPNFVRQSSPCTGSTSATL
ncbi:MAG: hypothetical protein OHK0019_31060 [Saprospiraceae bacterium]